MSTSVQLYNIQFFIDWLKYLASYCRASHFSHVIAIHLLIVVANQRAFLYEIFEKDNSKSTRAEGKRRQGQASLLPTTLVTKPTDTYKNILNIRK